MDTCISTSSMNHSNKFSCVGRGYEKVDFNPVSQSTRNNLGLWTIILMGRQCIGPSLNLWDQRSTPGRQNQN